MVHFLVPGPPFAITVTGPAEETYLIQWRSPVEPNGIILGYKVTEHINYTDIWINFQAVIQSSFKDREKFNVAMKKN